MKRGSPYAGPGPKLDKDALAAQRKEQYGFANLAKEQEFRSTNKGEAKELQDKIRELTDMLEDRKNANRLLTTENQRLKKMTADLQFQLLNKPTARGESAALKSMREMARQYKSQEEMTAAAAEKLITELMTKNQEAMDEMQRLGEERDGLESKLDTTQKALDDATEEIASYQKQQAELMDEKEQLIQQAQEREEEARKEIEARDAEIQSLQQQIETLKAEMEEARRAAEEALRQQKAALEAEAYLQRQQATAELQAQVASLQKLLDQAHDSLRSLNQTDTLGPGWKLQELGLPPPPRPEGAAASGAGKDAGGRAPSLRAEGSAASIRSSAAPPDLPPGSRRASRRPSRTGSVAGSVAGHLDAQASARAPSVAGSVSHSIAGSGPRSAAPPGSVANSMHLGQSGDQQGNPLEDPDPDAPPHPDADPDAAASGSRSRAGSRAPSVAASMAHSVRASDAEVPLEPVADPAGVSGHGEQPDGGVPSRAMSVAGSGRWMSNRGGVGRGGSQAAASVAGSRDGGRAGLGASRAESVAGEAMAASPRSGGGDGAAGITGAGDAAAAAVAAAPPPPPAPPVGPRGNILELLLHDASLHPGVVGLSAADFWALLRLACPGIGLVPVALSVAGASATPAAGSATLALQHAYRLHFPDDQSLLTAVSAGSARLLLHNLKPAVVGGFGCPRVVPAPAAAGIGGGGGGVAPGGGAGSGLLADGTMERVAVVASRDEHNCPSLDLFCIDDEGRPTSHFQTLTAPWRQQLPDAIPPPQPHEFCIDTHALHRLQADAARTSGLFDTAGRVFIGRSDGHTYLVWRLADVDARRKATFKALNRMIIEPTEDPWAAAAPLATAALPLTAALSAPTITRLELSNVRLLLGGQPVVRLYESSDDIATKTLACRTVAPGEKLVASVRMTARLAREPEVSEQLLAALQPALQAGSGAPTLPPLHWLSLLGAEELVLSRLLDELRAALGTAAGRIMAMPVYPHQAREDEDGVDGDGGGSGGGGGGPPVGGTQTIDDATAQELDKLGRQIVDTVLLKERQLAEGLASCQAVVVATSAGHPQEAPLARTRMEHIRTHVARSLAQLLAFFRQRLELYRLGAAAWHFITDGLPRLAALPATTTPPQAACLREILRALAAALQALAPPGVTAAELLTAAAAAPGAAGAAPPLMLLLPPALGSDPGAGGDAIGAASGGSSGAAAIAPAVVASGSLASAARGLGAALRAAVDAASTAASEACEALRREVAAPGTDDVVAAAAAQRRLASLAAPVTAALVTEMAAVCQAAVAASLAEPDTVAGLRHQVLAAARSGVTIAAAAATATAAGRAGLDPAAAAAAAGADLATALALQLGWQATAAVAMAVAGGPMGQPPGGAAGGDAGSRAALLLNSALQSLQWLVGAVTSAAPAPVAASPQSAGPWLRASMRLRTQLGLLCTSWSVAAVAAAGQALLLCGQRQEAVKLALEVMGREVDRVIDGTKATLEAIRANRSYDSTVLEESMPAIATTLSEHAVAAVSACFWTATQMLITPVLVTAHPPQDYMQAAATAAAAAAAAATRDGGAAAAAVAAAGAGGGGAYGAGSCYSPSLHVSSRVSFSLVTYGIVSAEPRDGPHAHGPGPLVGPGPGTGEGPLLVAADPPSPPPPPPGAAVVSPSAAVTAAAAAAAAAEAALAARPTEPALAPLSHPLLTSWQPRRSVLYLDIARMNAASAAAAAGPAAAANAPPSDPTLPVDTAGLPHLMRAAELLGWEVRHGEEYYKAYFAQPPAASAAAPPAPSTGPTPAGSVRGGSAGPGSVARSVASARSAGGGGAAALAADPVAALSEVKMAAEMARGSDIAIVAGGRMTEAGSMVKWLTQHGVLVLDAGELRPPAAAAAAANGEDEAARELARALVGLLAVHKLQAATVRALAPAPLLPSTAPPSAAVTPRAPRSRALTPRTSLTGDGAGTPPPLGPPLSSAQPQLPQQSPLLPSPPSAAAAAPPPPPLPQPVPVALLAYLTDLAIAKPALVACAELTHRIHLSLQALAAAFAAAPAVAPHSDMFARLVGAQLDQQALMLEGLLIAPELLRAKHPGTLPRPGAAAAAMVTVRTWQQAPPTSPGFGAEPLGVSPSAGVSRAGSMARGRVPLPSMTPRSTPRQLSQAGSMRGGPAVQGLGTPPRPLVMPPGPGPVAADAKSTDSEDEESGVLQLGMEALPDDSLERSSVASIATASTLGSMAGWRGGPGAAAWRG